MQFMSARWEDLILCNYAVPDELLLPRLPPGLELDRWGGSAYVSLVAFDFCDTRVLGVRWPGYVNFAEINLRFYVRSGDRRGVVFVREIVPQRFTAFAARALYNEPYVAAPIESVTKRTDRALGKEFVLDWQGRAQRIAVTGNLGLVRPPADSCEHFFKEHEWGFGISRAGRTTVYRVEHPHWDVYPVEAQALDFDFGHVYGPEWGFLTGRAPSSVAFAAGSAIKVFGLEATA